MIGNWGVKIQPTLKNKQKGKKNLKETKRK